MGITLDQLVFDDANPEDGANVGAYVRAGDDGTQIGHVSDALKVNFSNSSLVVTATDLDIRDLNFASDSVTSRLQDGSGNAISSTAGALDVNIASGADFDIRDLSHTQDSIKIGDGTDFMTVNTDGSINTKAAAPSNPKTSVVTAGVAAVEIAATPLSERTRILVQNNGSKDVFFGEANTVTTANGMRIPRGASMELPYGAAANLWVISSAAAQDLRVLELD